MTICCIFVQTFFDFSEFYSVREKSQNILHICFSQKYKILMYLAKHKLNEYIKGCYSHLGSFTYDVRKKRSITNFFKKKNSRNLLFKSQVNGLFFLLFLTKYCFQDSGLGTPVTLKIDKQGFYLYWVDQNHEMDLLDIATIRDVRTGQYAKKPKVRKCE